MLYCTICIDRKCNCNLQDYIKSLKKINKRKLQKIFFQIIELEKENYYRNLNKKLNKN